MTESLQKIYERNIRGDWPDKGSVHSYIEVYEELLAPYRYKAINILEIGLLTGQSLRMWAEYFTGIVYGIDSVDDASLYTCLNDGYLVKIGDASNPAEVNRFFSGIKFDVVIEDAGHDIEQQLKIYSVMMPYMNKGSLYIIEDVQDIDASRHFFECIGGEIIDRRKIKSRYDDVLIIIRNE